MTTSNWKIASLEDLKKQAALYEEIRALKKKRNILEVHTPILSTYGVTDPGLCQFTTNYYHPDGVQKYFLQTSPEFSMKRLLAIHQVPIYQLCKAFRNNGESGTWHMPEFTLLEWYEFTNLEIMTNHVCHFLTSMLDYPVQHFSYQKIFKQYLSIEHIHTCTHTELKNAMKKKHIHFSGTDWNKEECLQLALDWILCTHFRQTWVVISYFPSSQAMLSVITGDIALRAEIYFGGLEIANIFQELWSFEEQKQRFEHDNECRQQLGLEPIAIDTRLMHALQTPIPTCSGVAIGIDRCIAIALKQDQLIGAFTPLF